jgi:hypothetical protein
MLCSDSMIKMVKCVGCICIQMLLKVENTLFAERDSQVSSSLFLTVSLVLKPVSSFYSLWFSRAV